MGWGWDGEPGYCGWRGGGARGKEECPSLSSSSLSVFISLHCPVVVVVGEPGQPLLLSFFYRRVFVRVDRDAADGEEVLRLHDVAEPADSTPPPSPPPTPHPPRKGAFLRGGGVGVVVGESEDERGEAKSGLFRGHRKGAFSRERASKRRKAARGESRARKARRGRPTPGPGAAPRAAIDSLGARAADTPSPDVDSGRARD